MLLVWGKGYAQATAYQLEFLLVSLSYMGIFAFAVCLHALAGLRAYLDGEGRGALAAYGAIMVVVFICHPITAVFGFATAAAMLAEARAWKRGALLQAVPLLALGGALAWPWFDYWAVLTKGSSEAWFQMPLFENRAIALGPLMLAVPLVLSRFAQAVVRALGALLLRDALSPCGHPIGGRYDLRAFFLPGDRSLWRK
jgi:hypothetical protein